MRSARSSLAGASLLVGLGLTLAGCTTTQTTAARLQLNDSRLRAVSVPVRVRAADTSSTVTAVRKTLLAGRGAFTAVVSLDNHAGTAVSDLPISIGYTRGARTVYLNGGPSTASYFDDHIPAIQAHGSLVWVGTGKAGRIPRGARIFVRVGRMPSTSLGAFTPPMIKVTEPSPARTQASTTSHRTRGQLVLSVHISNGSSIPQYQLPVYTVVSRGAHVVTARARSISTLGGGAQAVLRIVLPATDGPAGADGIRVEAPPTIFK